VFAYVVEGEGDFDRARGAFANEACHPYGEGTVILYGPGNTVNVATDRKPVRFLLIAGRPFHEPIAWQGPIVMNTQEELRAAFREFQDGTFVKHN